MADESAPQGSAAAAASHDGGRGASAEVAPRGAGLARPLPPRAAARRYLIAGSGLLAGGLLLAVVLLLAGLAVTDSDRPINRWIFSLARSNDVLAELAGIMQRVGGVTITTIVVVVFSLVLLALRRWTWFAFLVTSAVGGALISEIVKNIVERPRPVWPDSLYSEVGFSYPSGHTLSGITSWVAMGIVVLYLVPRPWGTVAGWSLVVFGALLGPSRWLYGVHWITDVLGGWLFGFGWLLLVCGIFVRRYPAVPDALPGAAATGGGAYS